MAFDGVGNFILGRRHYDAQFYLINNSYSDTLADSPIFRVTYENSAKNRPNLWGDRAYYSGSSKKGEPMAWLGDNLPTDLPDITPAWTFDGKWDPETRLAQIKVHLALYETRRITP